jgi:hypothetical protein
MRPRWSTHACALTGLAAALAVAAPALSEESGLPECPAAGPSRSAPATVPSLDDPAACRAAPARILESARRGDRGYTHLGAVTAGEWAGVSGRTTVRDAAVRPGTADFLASRFMVKRELGEGRVAWLEAGWAETGWAGDGRQRIYTYDTSTGSWAFYDQYALRDGDRAWLDLRTDGTGVWQAWLWWGGRWNLLTAPELPLGPTAQIEQFVEVHVDAGHPAHLGLPAVSVDNVQLIPAGGGTPVYWREQVPTVTGGTDAAARTADATFCVSWASRYDTWSAADC